MSDFLMRLAQRQLGQILSVEPRVPSIHEPAAETPHPILDEASAAKSDAPRNTGAPPRLDSSFIDSHLGLSASEVAGGVTDDADAPIPIIHHPERPESLNPARPLASQSTEQVFSRGAEQSDETEAEPLVWPEFARARGNASLPLPAHAGPEVPDPLLKIPSVPSNRQPIARHAPPSLVKRGTRTVAAQPPHLAAAHGERAAKPDTSREQAGEEPPVQITIGRIEVTAITASTPSKRPTAPRKLAMSLDDYLRRQRRER